MPNIDLSILNQRATPAFFADTLANRPAPSFVGRIFISTDTLDLYRDTGTAWLLLSPSSTGTITGSGAAGQVTIFSGASSINGTNNLFWDTSNLRLGINTNTPGAALDLHSTASTLMQLNQTTATNDTRIAFQNSGTALWRIGNFYNAGANDWGIFDVVGAAQPFTIKKTTGQTFIGAETTSSGRLVVNNTTGDNHIVVIGATAPSIRINNAGSGATRQIGIGLATAVNNFIQGAAGGEMAIFNSNTTASPILFGIYDAGLGNTQEAARISASRNLLVGGSVDGGQKLQVTGSTLITGNSVDIFTATGIGSSAASGLMRVISGGTSVALAVGQSNSTRYTGIGANFINVYNDDFFLTTTGAFPLSIGTNNTARLTISSTGAATFSSSVTANGISSIGQEQAITWQRTTGSASDIYSLNADSGSAYLYNNTTANALMTWLENGNVGIGTTAPNGKLQIYLDSITAGNAPAASGTTPVNAMLNLTNNRGIGMYFGGSYAGNYGQWIQVSDTGNLGVNYPLYLNPNGGNLLIGTTTDAGQKLQVNGSANILGTIIGQQFTTASGSVSNPYNVWTTMFTIPTNNVAMYQLIAVSQGNGLTYTASALIVVNDSAIELRNYTPGGALTLRISGYDVQCLNGSGSTLAIVYKYIRMA